MSVEHADLGVVRGENWVTILDLQNADKTPQDLTGRTVTFVAAPTVSATPTLVLTDADDPAAVLVDPTAGRVTLTLDPTVTATLPVTSLYAVWLDAGLLSADPVMAGTLTVVRVVTPV